MAIPLCFVNILLKNSTFIIPYFYDKGFGRNKAMVGNHLVVIF